MIGTHGTALSTILNFYDNSFGCEDFLRIIDWMPYIIELDFECSCKAICVHEEVAKADSELDNGDSLKFHIKMGFAEANRIICFTKRLVNPVIGRRVTVTVDRPLGSYYPRHKDIYYSINYGYIEEIMAPDGEEQDAYILGVDIPVENFTGKVIAIVHRNDDVEEKWVVAPKT